MSFFTTLLQYKSTGGQEILYFPQLKNYVPDSITTNKLFDRTFVGFR